jgi:putative lipoprotein
MIVFTIFTISFCSKTQAQKQSRVERLYQHIAWSEGDKYDRLRERMDTKSMDAYKNEITLADALRQLLLTPGINAIEPYLKSNMAIQQQDGGARLRSFCQAVNLNVNLFRHKADSTIFALLVYSKNQLEDSRTVLAQIKEYDYNIDPDIYEAIVRLKEKVQYADLKAQPTEAKCDTYFKDFHNQYNYVEVAQIYNDLLYKAALDKQNDSTILCYFNDTTLKTFYANTKEPRPYLTEVQKLYDDCLFKAIQTATSPEAQKHCINAYIECPYLAGCNRRYLPQVEYANDSIDLIILVSQVDSFPRLPLIKAYLQTHKYKQFRDKAQQLREQFIDSMTYISPTITRCYSGTNIVRETRTHNDSLTITTYQYSPQGLLTRIIQSTRLQKDSTTTTPLNLIVTTFRYNDLGKCYEEETIDSLAKATVCLINYQYDTTSHPVMKTTKWNHGQNTIDYYNHRGQVNRTQEYRNGLICAQTDYTYDTQGRLSGKTWINNRPDTDHPATKQVTLYTYDPFGYLVSISYVKENLQNEKITSNMTLTYDEFGNPINPNYQYTYDQTGAWTSKTSKTNPADSEKIAYVYKQNKK